MFSFRIPELNRCTYLSSVTKHIWLGVLSQPGAVQRREAGPGVLAKLSDVRSQLPPAKT